MSARLRTILLALCALPLVGCSTLGLSFYPTGSVLTDDAEKLIACSPTPANVPREQNKDVLPGHYLQPGDSVLIESVSDEADVRLPSDQRVLADGTVDLGRYGRVIVAGGTLESAEELIEQTVATVVDRIGTTDGEDIDVDELEINVRLIEDNHRYYVLGEVNSPGIYSLEGHETVLDGILEAGGLTDAASACNIILARPTDACGCRITLPVCYRQLTQMGDTATNYQLRPGDRIFVASRTCCEEFWFCKAGETCERCKKCQQPCRHPEYVAPANPMARVASMPIVASLPLAAGGAGSAASGWMNDGGEGVGSSNADVTGDAAGDAESDATGRDESGADVGFPNLLESPRPIDATGRGGGGEPDGGDAPRGGGMDGQLDFDAAPKTSRRFKPMWIE